jgi:hypothetical protein
MTLPINDNLNTDNLYNSLGTGENRSHSILSIDKTDRQKTRVDKYNIISYAII